MREPDASNAASIIELALGSLARGTREPVEIKLSQVNKIRSAIDTLTNAVELRAVAEELLRVAQFLDVEKASKTASRSLASLAGHAAKLMHKVRGTLSAMNDAVAKAASRYKSFKDDRPTFAPQYGAKKPKNSVTVDSLHPMRRV